MIAGLTEGPLDWTRLLHLARQHGVVPLLHHQLETIAPGRPPVAVLDELRRDMVASAWRSVRLARELVAILQALRARDILALPYKGPALAVAAYGSVTLRHFTDLDVLVPAPRIADARSILCARGYRDAHPASGRTGRVARSHYQHALVRDHDRVVVELHWAVTPRYFRFPLKLETLALEPLVVEGVTISSIAPPDLLVLLCVHGCRHLWSRLAWVCDLAELLSSRRETDWALALSRAEALGARRMLLVGLALARALLAADLPAPLALALSGDPAAARLAERLGERLFRDDGHPVPLWRAARLHLAMRERRRDQAVYALLAALVPSERDVSVTGARRALLRPFRLLREHGLRRPRR